MFELDSLAQGTQPLQPSEAGFYAITLVSPRRRANVGQRDSFVRATSPRDVGLRA